MVKKLCVILGRVTDKKQVPISDVKVGITKGTASYPDIIALTDDNGEYDLDNIPTGTFEVVASKEKYESQMKIVKLTGEDETRLDFILSSKD